MAGIVAGVVVGVVVVAAILGGIFFYMRMKRNREIEEDHRRNAAVNAFMGGKPPGSSGGYSMEADTRLDPVMAQRRLSSGSIADNQDYSRRILRVCSTPSRSLLNCKANNTIGHKCVSIKPVYDERLLPVLYFPPIGILRRLGDLLCPRWIDPRDESLAFIFGVGEATIGSLSGCYLFPSEQPLLTTYTVLSFTILRHFFRYARAARLVR